jgi:hypothetical protein
MFQSAHRAVKPDVPVQHSVLYYVGVAIPPPNCKQKRNLPRISDRITVCNYAEVIAAIFDLNGAVGTSSEHEALTLVEDVTVTADPLIILVEVKRSMIAALTATVVTVPAVQSKRMRCMAVRAPVRLCIRTLLCVHLLCRHDRLSSLVEVLVDTKHHRTPPLSIRAKMNSDHTGVRASEAMISFFFIVISNHVVLQRV